MRVLVFACFGLCCAGPASLLSLSDAETESDRASAVATAARALATGRTGPAAAAALTLGRLRIADPAAVEALAAACRPGRAPEVRDAAAWALGELRYPSALPPLFALLITETDRDLIRRALQGLAQHQAVLAAEPELAVQAAEAMTQLRARVPDLPPEFRWVSERTRSIDVDIRVVTRAVAAHRSSPSAATATALYTAAFDLLDRLDRLRAALGSAPEGARVEEAIRAASEAASLADPEVERLVVWFFGTLTRERGFARAASEAVVEGGHHRKEAFGDRAIAAWALGEAQIHALAARRALTQEVLPLETRPEVLRVLGAMTPEGAEDILQRVLGIEVRR